LRLPRVNLFIADDVGLGKTIEAGLVARELLMRKKVTEIVVACPPSMLVQWKEELESRFGLQFAILDRDYVQEVRRERGFGINPWTTHPRFLVSHRLLIDESYRAPLLDWLGNFRPGSLLILDEAHDVSAGIKRDQIHRFRRSHSDGKSGFGHTTAPAGVDAKLSHTSRSTRSTSPKPPRVLG
jgi:SNF2 family DNA or RNA helicase